MFENDTTRTPDVKLQSMTSKLISILTYPSMLYSPPQLHNVVILLYSSNDQSGLTSPQATMSWEYSVPIESFAVLFPSKYTMLRGRVVMKVRCQHLSFSTRPPQKITECSGSNAAQSGPGGSSEC
ncbi:hypothetical protein PISMIDRAFT_681236, partial [Pisolithus microcarpus 441]